MICSGVSCKNSSSAAVSSSDGKKESWFMSLIFKVARWVAGLAIVAGRLVEWI